MPDHELTSNATSLSEALKGSVRWPVIIVALLGAHLLFMLSAAAIAMRDRSFAVVPNYYQAALNWDKTQSDRRASERLGWKLTIEPGMQVDPLGRRQVNFLLSDAQERPLAGAALNVSYYHHSHASDPVEAGVPQTAPGVFTAVLPMRFAGFWQFDVRASVGEKTFTTSLTQYVSNEAPGEHAMTAMIAAIFIASLLGSLHCVGMCGAFVALAVGDSKGWRSTTAYHGGRLISYIALGAVAGAAGQLLDIAGGLAGIRPLAAAVAGTTMVLFGLVALLRSYGVRIAQLRLPASWTRLVSCASAAAMNRPPTVRASIIGLCTTLLPCGWLYAFAITAAGTGNPLTGAAAMAVFWAGTVPALLIVGVSVRSLLGPLGRRAPLLASLLLVAIGIYTLIGRTRLDPIAVARASHARSAAAATDEPPACCTTGHDP